MPPRSLRDVLKEREGSLRSQAFQPSSSWQEIPNGTAVPPGGEFRMDMNTGKNYGRWNSISSSPPTPPPPDENPGSSSIKASLIQILLDQANVKFNSARFTQSQAKTILGRLTPAQLSSTIARSNKISNTSEEPVNIDDVLRIAEEERLELGHQGIQGKVSDKTKLDRGKKYFTDLVEHLRINGADSSFDETTLNQFKSRIKEFKDVNAVNKLITDSQTRLDNFIAIGTNRTSAIEALFSQEGFEPQLAAAGTIPKSPKPAPTPKIVKGPIRLTDAQLAYHETIASGQEYPGNIRTYSAQQAGVERIRRFHEEIGNFDVQPEDEKNVSRLRNPASTKAYIARRQEGASPADALEGTRLSEKYYARSQMGLLESVQLYGNYVTTQGQRRGTLNFLGALLGGGVSPTVKVAGGLGALAYGGLEANQALSTGQYLSNISGQNINGFNVPGIELSGGMSFGDLSKYLQQAARFGTQGNNLVTVQLANIMNKATGTSVEDALNLVMGQRNLGASQQTLEQLALFGAGGVAGATGAQVQQIIGQNNQANIVQSPEAVQRLAASVAKSPQLIPMNQYAQAVLSDSNKLRAFQAATGMSDKQIAQIVQTGDTNAILQGMRSQFLPGGRFASATKDITGTTGANVLAGYFGVENNPQLFERFINAKGLDINLSPDQLKANQNQAYAQSLQNAYAKIGPLGYAMNTIGDLVQTLPAIPETIYNLIGSQIFGLPGRGGVQNLGQSGAYRGLTDLLINQSPQEMINKLDLSTTSDADLAKYAQYYSDNPIGQANALATEKDIRRMEIDFVQHGGQITVTDGNDTVKKNATPAPDYLNKSVSNTSSNSQQPGYLRG